jgi:hypothetical protein
MVEAAGVVADGLVGHPDVLGRPGQGPRRQRAAAQISFYSVVKTYEPIMRLYGWRTGTKL